MFVQPTKHFSFSRIGSQVANERRFRRIGPQLLNRCLIILHGCPRESS